MTTRILACLFTLLIATTSTAGPGYQQGFEFNLDGWDAFGGDFNATRVSSGTNGVASATGNWHAESNFLGGAATNLGGYTCCFPNGGYEVSIDLYLDFSWADGSDKRFNVTHAINGTDCAHFVDFVMAIGTKPNDPGKYIISASQNCPGWPSDPGREPQVITNGTGWYTLKYILRDEAGILDVDVELRTSGGALVGFWELPTNDPTNPGNPIPISKVTGNRYLWFCQPGGGASNIDHIYFDNVTQTAADPCEGFLPVEKSHWSMIKSLYR